MEHIETVKELIACYKKLPGIGTKTAERLAYATLRLSKIDRDAFQAALSDLDSKVKLCPRCGTFFEDRCPICSDPKRNKQLLLVVSDSKDILAIERTNTYNGLYFTLNGNLSPLKNKTAKDIGIDELKKRVETEQIQEVILALPTSLEGETTALYITNILKDLHDVKVSRLAYGIPIGTNLEYLDEMTISQSLKGRVVISGENK